MAQGDSWKFFDRRSVTSNVTIDIRPAVGVSVKVASIIIAGTDANTNSSRGQVYPYDFEAGNSANLQTTQGTYTSPGFSNANTGRVYEDIFIQNSHGLRMHWRYSANYTGAAAFTGVQIK